MADRGTLTLSLEVELAWGFHDKDNEPPFLSDRRREETRILHRLLKACDELDVPISFDIVGHLFLEDCEGTHVGPYADQWFDEDPGTNVDVDPKYYAPELVRIIRDADCDHEICTHTFSHLLCDEASDELLDQELDRVQELHDEWNLPPARSFVAPRHQDASRSVLRDHEIRVIRMADEEFRPPTNPVREYISSFSAAAPIRAPHVVDGVVETDCTPRPSLTASSLPTGQVSPHPSFRVLPQRLRRRLHTRALVRSVDRAIAEGSYVHHWSHLYNLANDAQWAAVQPFLEAVAQRRDEGHLRVETMDRLASKAVAGAADGDDTAASTAQPHVDGAKLRTE